jgi:FKBP-type peptidyl-prolyl cis-trans isomerase SlyD
MSSLPAVIAKDQVVALHYTLREDDGDVLDSSVGGEPLAYLHGHGGIVPGLEAALDGRRVGDRFKIDVPPEQGYGYPTPHATRRIPRAVFPADAALEEGDQFYGPGATGEPTSLWVVSATSSYVEVTTNHPLAGYVLHFEIEVMDVRPATAEELEHGHVHGPDGHGHDDE